MKIKTFLLALVAILTSLSCSARDEYTTDVSVLPQTATQTISTHFPKTAISHIKIDKDVFGIDGYDVILNDGSEIEFDSKGTLKEVDCNRNGNVPKGLIPVAIREYTSKNYPNQNIVKYDVKRKGYEIQLQSGLELIFDKQGLFRGIDD